MKLYTKNADNVELLAFPDEQVERGDYLVIEDPKQSKALIVQILDVRFADFPGVMEDLIRDSVTEEHAFGDDFDPLGLNSQITALRDTRLVVAKARCTVKNGKASNSIAWSPSRVCSQVRHIDSGELIKLMGIGAKRPIFVGFSRQGSKVSVDAEAFDGRLSIILGRKGTGKSHLSKLLLLGLIDHGAPCIVLDVNGEYVGLNTPKAGGVNVHHRRIMVLEPSRNLRVTLRGAGLSGVMNVLTHALGLPSTSTREFYRMWRFLERRGMLSLSTLEETIRDWDCHESVKEAILSRYHALVNSGLFADDEAQGNIFEESLRTLADGGAVVINLKETSTLSRAVVVEFTLGKLADLLRSRTLPAAFLFAEEAHLYLRETYWEDLITRMRHLGLFVTFITNQPDSIHPTVYRQVDSIFLFNFRNEHDLDALSKVARIDADTLRLMGKTLEPFHCLALGEVTGEIPLVLRVRELDVATMGETRRLFA